MREAWNSKQRARGACGRTALPWYTYTLNVPGAVHLRISAFHCASAITGKITRVPPLWSLASSVPPSSKTAAGFGSR